MKSYSLTPQERRDFCVCSCLQAVLREYEKELSQEDIARNLTPSKDGFLVDDENIKDFMGRNNLGYDFFGYNATPFNEPDMVLREVDEKDVLVLADRHARLLLSFEDPC